MKKNKNIIILICIIIAIAVISVIAVLSNTPKIDKLLEDENIQVETLVSIYKDILSKVNAENANIILNESALKNLLNNENFTEENILKLKELEKINEQYEENYTLYLAYNKDEYILTSVVVGIGAGNTKTMQKYKLEVKDKSLTYMPYGETTKLFE